MSRELTRKERTDGVRVALMMAVEEAVVGGRDEEEEAEAEDDDKGLRSWSWAHQSASSWAASRSISELISLEPVDAAAAVVDCPVATAADAAEVEMYVPRTQARTETALQPADKWARDRFFVSSGRCRMDPLSAGRSRERSRSDGEDDEEEDDEGGSGDTRKVVQSSWRNPTRSFSAA
jgi:hypothetical protein